ncbi:MAG: MFS transporter [Phycisphaerales bacterium]|nr:MFS transporter [Phycisphaerae bacterium]NNM25334.1 MFS transporter [Phycisphaerales bacterium]
MAQRAWLNRETFGWAMFDFANQAFALVILTTMYQLYFVYHVVADDESLGRQLWAASNITTQVIVILISPIVGALADFSGAKKKLLLITYAGCVVLTAALGLVPPGAAALGMILFICGYLFYATGENFMGAFLPELAEHRDMGKVSAFGFTLGYTGGLVCLAGAVILFMRFEGPTGFRLACVWAGLFFLVAALPTFIFVRERKLREELPPGQTIVTVGFHRVASTFRSIRQYRHLFRYLLIMTFYLAGMQIVIFFGGTIAQKLFDLEMKELGIYVAVSAASAIVGAFTTMLFQDRVGTRNTILLALVLWTVIMIAAAFIRPEWKALFWAVGGGVGFGMGMLGTSSRAMVGLFSPKHKSAEFFGFYGQATKISAILGLALTILTEHMFAGRYNLVVASSGIFFIGGLVLMLGVNERDGRIAAIRATRAHIRRHHDYAETNRT